MPNKNVITALTGHLQNLRDAPDNEVARHQAGIVLGIATALLLTAAIDHQAYLRILEIMENARNHNKTERTTR